MSFFYGSFQDFLLFTGFWQFRYDVPWCNFFHFLMLGVHWTSCVGLEFQPNLKKKIGHFLKYFFCAHIPLFSFGGLQYLAFGCLKWYPCSVHSFNKFFCFILYFFIITSLSSIFFSSAMSNLLSFLFSILSMLYIIYLFLQVLFQS